MLITGIHTHAALVNASMPRRFLLMVAACLAALPAAPAWSAAAQIADFPNKPIRVVHGFAAGGDAVNLPDVRQRWSALGGESIPMTPEQFDKFIAEQIATFTKLARAAGIKAN